MCYQNTSMMCTVKLETIAERNEREPEKWKGKPYSWVGRLDFKLSMLYKWTYRFSVIH